METKTDIRKSILRKRMELEAEEVQERSEKICRYITQCQAFLTSDTIYGYVPIRNEADIMPVLRLALRMGKKVALPRTCKEDMDFYLIRDFSELEPGSFSVPEPSENCPSVADSGLMLIPMVAFDLNGNRLGYGKGYYDRYIEKSRKKYQRNNNLYGIAYEFQKVSGIPAEHTDCPLDYIITDNQVLKVRKKEC